jgi:hypothetical protein
MGCNGTNAIDPALYWQLSWGQAHSFTPQSQQPGLRSTENGAHLTELCQGSASFNAASRVAPYAAQ